MRKNMSKEIPFTIIKAGKFEVVNDLPTVTPLEPIKVLGDLTKEKAQKHMDKLHKGLKVIVYEATIITETYEMAVADFIKVASLKSDNVEDVEEHELEGVTQEG